MKLQFDINNNVEDFTIVLSTRSYEHYGEIANIKRDSVTCKRNMNSANELSFEVYKNLDGYEERLWDEIKDFKLVWVKELNEYFEIYVSFDDTIAPIKTVTATSLCEAELGQVNLYGIEINTEADIAREDYDKKNPTTFYNEDNHKISLLHRVLSDKVPHYSIKHVDSSLMDLQRSFSIDGTDIYSWLTGECSEQFNCLFLFDSTDRSISVYDLYTVCRDCGHRGEYNDVCPECGGTDLKYYGEDTTIYVDKENLTESVKLETDEGSVKNCFKLEAGDDDMTAAVINANPNGTAYIYYVSDEQKEDMPDELVELIESYDELVKSYTEEYEQLADDMYDVIDDILYYKSSMMPTIEHAKVTASTEAAKLTSENLSPVAITSVTESTSKATVENALKNYAKVYVKTGYVKLEINESEFTYIEENLGQWTGNFKVTNYSDEEDVVESETITVDVGGGNAYYETFLRQKMMKSIADDDDDDGSIFNVLAEDDIEEFKTYLTEYCLNRLQSFADAIQGALDVLIQADQASEEADLYSVLYEPYHEKLEACNNEINVRSATIVEFENRYNELETRRREIQKELNFEDYLGEEFYPIFCSYRREDTYSNTNYISDGLDNAKIFDNARKFMKVAKEELYKAAQPKHSISTTLYNLLVMPEFQVIVDKFELGNWIRVGVDGDVYRLRLLSYEINFGDIQTLNVEFSDLTKQVGCVSDVKNILDSAKSMATNFSYVSKQAEKGNEASESLSNVVDNGLNSSLVQIKNNTHEEVTYGKHGILCKEYDDFIDDYSPEQLKITHNVLVFTEDNWKTSSLGLGKHQYTYFDGSKFTNAIGYGLSAKFLQAPYVYGGQIISGDVYSTNYSPTDGKGAHINLDNGSFTLADSKIVYDADTSKLTLKGIDIDWSTSSTPEVTDIDGLGTALDSRPTKEQMNAAISLSEEGIISTVSQSYATQEQLNNLQQQIDGAIETFTGNEMPTLENEPAVEWTTDEIKDSHVGDLYIVGSEGGEYAGFYYRFEKLNGVYQWVLLQDNEIAKALEEARKANEAAQAVADDLATNYSTTVDMNSAIEQSATSIKSTVNEQITETKTYADTVASNAANSALNSANASTDEKLVEYAKTSDVNSAIEQKADSIILSVDEKITETKTYADTAATNAVNNANASTDAKLKNYSTTTQMNSAITVAKNEIASTVSETYETKTDATTKYNTLSSSITQNANNIALKVSQSDYNGKELVSLINQTAEAVTIDANKINLNGVVTANNTFQINTDGSMKATGGTIGGFTIGNTAIYNGTNSMSSKTVGIYLGTNGIRLYGSDSAYVNIASGKLTAIGANLSSATVSGTLTTGALTATGGTIGGWTIGTSSIYNGTNSMSSTTVGTYIGTSGIRQYKSSSAYVNIQNGIITAKGADIGGKVALAKGSSIGGMKADSNSIFGNGSAITDANPSWSSITKGFAFMCPGGTNTKISLGNSSKMSGWVFGCYPHFGVTSEGNIYGTKAYFNSVKDDGAEIRIIDENTNNITFKGDSIKMSYTGYNGELRATGLYFSSATLDGVAGELTLGGQTLTESALEKLLELI